MHKFVKNIVMLLALAVFALTACTGKEDIVLNLSDTVNDTGTANGMGIGQEAEGLSETEDGVLPENGNLARISDETADTVPSEIYVHICGAVVNPGVYELEEGSRVFEGIKAAGGFREDACEDYVNQAGQLQDGERLVIPTEEEIEAAKADGTYQELWSETASGLETQETETPGSSGGRVNINTATESELGSISGIGAGKAAAIVKYRQENGSFTSVEDIMNVSGIKEGTYDKIKDKITVN